MEGAGRRAGNRLAHWTLDYARRLRAFPRDLIVAWDQSSSIPPSAVLRTVCATVELDRPLWVALSGAPHRAQR